MSKSPTPAAAAGDRRCRRAGSRRRRAGANGGGSGAPTSCTNGSWLHRPSARRRRPRPAAARAPPARSAPRVLAAPSRQEARNDHAGHPLRLAADGAASPAFTLVAVAHARPRHRRQRHDVQLGRRACMRQPSPASRDAERLVALNGTTRTRGDLSVSYPDFRRLCASGGPPASRI